MYYNFAALQFTSSLPLCLISQTEIREEQTLCGHIIELKNLEVFHGPN